MKKLLATLVLSLMLSSTHAYAICILGVGNCEAKTEWKLVSMSADEDTKVYIDKQTVSKIGNNFIFMQLNSREIPIKVYGTTWYSDIAKVEVDCTNNNSRDLSLTFYEKKMGKGKKYITTSINDDWEQYMPGSVMIMVVDYFCKYGMEY